MTWFWWYLFKIQTVLNIIPDQPETEQHQLHVQNLLSVKQKLQIWRKLQVTNKKHCYSQSWS